MARWTFKRRETTLIKHWSVANIDRIPETWRPSPFASPAARGSTPLYCKTKIPNRIHKWAVTAKGWKGSPRPGSVRYDQRSLPRWFRRNQFTIIIIMMKGWKNIRVGWKLSTTSASMRGCGGRRFCRTRMEVGLSRSMSPPISQNPISGAARRGINQIAPKFSPVSNAGIRKALRNTTIIGSDLKFGQKELDDRGSYMI